MTFTGAQMFPAEGQGGGPVLPFHLRNNQLAVVRTEDSSRLADAGRAHMALDGGTRMGHFHL